MFFLCNKPWVASNRDSLCHDVVRAMQIPGLSSGYCDEMFYLEAMCP